jgi:hypothetical protein
MTSSRLSFRILIYVLLLVSFYLGLPHMHYAVALMIVLLIRAKDLPGGLFSPVDSLKL